MLYTDDCRSTQPNCHLVKFADNTVLLSLLSGPSQHHCKALKEIVECCDNSCLELNLHKTEEMGDIFQQKAGTVCSSHHNHPWEGCRDPRGIQVAEHYLRPPADICLRHRGDPQEIPTAAVSPEQTQVIWGQ